jgi:hypothetical protein
VAPGAVESVQPKGDRWLGLGVTTGALEYDAAFGGDHGVQLVENTVTAWCDALSRLVINAEARRCEGQKVVEHYRRHHILGADPQALRGAIRRGLAPRPAQRAA